VSTWYEGGGGGALSTVDGAASDGGAWPDSATRAHCSAAGASAPAASPRAVAAVSSVTASCEITFNNLEIILFKSEGRALGAVAGAVGAERRRGECVGGQQPHHGATACDAACPLSTRGGTRLVRLVREGGGGGADLRARAERVELGGRGVEARLQGRDPGAHARVHPACTGTSVQRLRFLFPFFSSLILRKRGASLGALAGGRGRGRALRSLLALQPDHVPP